MNTKIIPVILLVIILAIGGMAFTFYQQNDKLKNDNADLAVQNETLSEEKNKLKYAQTKLDRQLKDAKQQLSAIQTERDELKQKAANDLRMVEELKAERDKLVERLKSGAVTQQVAVSESRIPVEVGDIPEDHWADFVKKKASLEAQVDTLNEHLLEAKNKIAGLDTGNKELSIKIDQLKKDTWRLAEEIKFKERTLRVMSMDLVSEREERSSAVKELSKLRNENVSLKRELVLANKEQMKLQDTLKVTMDKKHSLEARMSDAENVLKEKSLAFSELQNDLKQAISGGKRITASETASVELPPIIVKPSAPGLRGLRGEIIAVNREEKFIVIDLGESSGLRPGVLLKAMRGDREIATVEVIETRKEISAADIKEMVGGFNIQEGDLVISR